MCRFQTLIVPFLIISMNSAKASTCQKFEFQGLVKKKSDQFFLVVFDGSYSETTVSLPKSVQMVLATELNRRVTLQAVARKTHTYSFDVIEKPQLTGYYPFVTKLKGAISNLGPLDSVDCELHQ